MDEALSGLHAAVAGLLNQAHVLKRVEKLQRDGRDEQHLFVVADESAFPFSVVYPLMARDTTPTGSPMLAGDLTHLWLLVTFTPWILIGTKDSWTRYARDDYPENT